MTEHERDSGGEPSTGIGLLRESLKQGAWFTLTCLILWFLGYQVDKRLVPLVERYVITTENAVRSLESTTSQLGDASEETNRSLTATQRVLAEHREMLMTNQKYLMSLAERMDAASEHMKDVPRMRQQELDLLKEIRDAVSRRGPSP